MVDEAGNLTRHRCVRDGALSAGTTIIRTGAPRPFLLVTALWFLLIQAAMAVETRNVLVVYSNNRLVPGNVEVDRGLRAAMVSSAERPVTILSEFLDNPEFSGDGLRARDDDVSAPEIRRATAGCDCGRLR